MSKVNRCIRFSRPTFVACLFFVFASTPAASEDTACPKPTDLKDLTPPTCPASPKDPKCETCKTAVEAQTSKVNKFKSSSLACQTKEMICKGEASRASESELPQRASMSEAERRALYASNCYKELKRKAEDAETAARECHEEIEKSCSGVPAGLKEGSKCKDAAKKAKKKKEEAGAKEKAAGDNADKNGDNKKKEDSAGGGMPQMPQMPQQQQGNDQPQTPQEQAQYPEGTSPTPTSTAPKIEVSKFDDGKSDLATPSVGFGNGTSTDTHTGLGANASFPAQSFGSDSAFRSPASSDTGSGGGGSVAATGVPSGGGGGLAGAGNSTGASRPGDGKGGDAAKAADGANPYEVAVGSGGRLGVPKGKSAGDADAPIDSAATTAFNSEFKADGGAGAGDQAAGGDEEDVGYTIFKQVKYRYSELKKKGNI